MELRHYLINSFFVVTKQNIDLQYKSGKRLVSLEKGKEK